MHVGNKSGDFATGYSHFTIRVKQRKFAKIHVKYISRLVCKDYFANRNTILRNKRYRGEKFIRPRLEDSFDCGKPEPPMPPILNLGGASFTLGATFGICRGGSISGWVRKPEKWRRLECLRGSSGWKPLPFCAATWREGHMLYIWRLHIGRTPCSSAINPFSRLRDLEIVKHPTKTSDAQLCRDSCGKIFSTSIGEINGPCLWKSLLAFAPSGDAGDIDLTSNATSIAQIGNRSKE